MGEIKIGYSETEAAPSGFLDSQVCFAKEGIEAHQPYTRSDVATMHERAYFTNHSSGFSA